MPKNNEKIEEVNNTLPDDDKRCRSIFMQANKYYDTHDSDGNPRNPDPDYFGQISRPITDSEWIKWRTTMLIQLAKAKMATIIFEFHDRDYKLDDDGKIIFAPAKSNGNLLDSHGNYDINLLQPILEDSGGHLQVEPVIKPLHFHAVLKLANQMSLGAVRREFKLSRTRADNCQKIINWSEASSYLLHSTNNAKLHRKYFYDESGLRGYVCDKDLKLLAKKYGFSNHATIKLPVDFSDDGKKYKTKEIKVPATFGMTNINAVRPMYHYFVAKALTGAHFATPKVIKSFTNTTSEKLHDGAIIPQMSDILWHKQFSAKANTNYHTAKPVFNDQWQNYLMNKQSEYLHNGRKLTTILVTGAGGVGKTNLAEKIAFQCDPRWWQETTGAGKNKTGDIVDGYRGEDVAVANELSGSAENLRTWCELLDPYHLGKASHRGKNIDWLVTKLIMTCSDNLSKWVTDCIYPPTDDISNLVLPTTIRNLLLRDWELVNLTTLPNANLEKLASKCIDKGSNNAIFETERRLAELENLSWQLMRRIPWHITIYDNSRYSGFSEEPTGQGRCDSFTLGMRITDTKPIENYLANADALNKKLMRKPRRPKYLEPFIGTHYNAVNQGTFGISLAEDAPTLTNYNLAWSKFPLYTVGNAQKPDTIIVLEHLDEKARRYKSILGFGLSNRDNAKQNSQVAKVITDFIGISANEATREMWERYKKYLK